MNSQLRIACFSLSQLPTFVKVYHLSHVPWWALAGAGRGGGRGLAGWVLLLLLLLAGHPVHSVARSHALPRPALPCGRHHPRPVQFSWVLAVSRLWQRALSLCPAPPCSRGAELDPQCERSDWSS